MGIFTKLFKNKKEEVVYGAARNSDFNITPNFKYSEFVSSPTATKYGIQNIPNDEELNNIVKLCKTVLQPIRDKYGKSIKVNSGFRGRQLNAKVGGAANSDHLFGAAADIKAGDGNNRRLFDLILKMIQNKEIQCRQLIWEYGTKVQPQWIHIAVNHNKNKTKNNQVVYLYNK